MSVSKIFTNQSVLYGEKSGKESEEVACSFFSSHAMTYPINYLYHSSSLKIKICKIRKNMHFIPQYCDNEKYVFQNWRSINICHHWQHRFASYIVYCSFINIVTTARENWHYQVVNVYNKFYIFKNRSWWLRHSHQRNEQRKTDSKILDQALEHWFSSSAHYNSGGFCLYHWAM